VYGVSDVKKAREPGGSADSFTYLQKMGLISLIQFQSLLGKQSSNSISAFAIPADMLSIMKHVPLHFGKWSHS